MPEIAWCATIRTVEAGPLAPGEGLGEPAPGDESPGDQGLSDDAPPAVVTGASADGPVSGPAPQATVPKVIPDTVSHSRAAVRSRCRRADVTPGCPSRGCDELARTIGDHLAFLC